MEISKRNTLNSLVKLQYFFLLEFKRTKKILRKLYVYFSFCFVCFCRFDGIFGLN